MRRRSTELRKIAGSILSLLLAASCATQPPTTAHMEATQYEQEHDEMVYPHTTIDLYPNRNAPQEIVVRKDDGRSEHFTCLNSGCTEMVGTIKGSKTLPDGSYQIIQTDDPKLSIVRDPEGTTIIGYLVDSGPTDSKIFQTLDDAHSYEHRGDNLKLAGKIALGTLVVGALVVGAAAAAAADSRANTITTTCSSFGNSTTCTSR